VFQTAEFLTISSIPEMQRIHGWLDQLTLRRSRRRGESLNSRRNVSQSVAPSCRLNLESKAKKHELRQVNMPMIVGNAPGSGSGGGIGAAAMMTRKPETGSFARRRGIRTNPWLYGDSLSRSGGSFRAEAQSLDRRCPPPTMLGVKSLDESTCSSGYGSQDCSSEQLSSLDDSRTSSPIYACPESPIYAQPWTNYDLVPERRGPNIILTTERSPTTKALVVRNQSFRRVLPETPSEYATPYAVSSPISYFERTNSLVYPGSYFSRVVNASKANQTDDEETFQDSKAGRSTTMEESEEEFLIELDAQIAELQLRSDELRSIVEKARLRRNSNWLRPPMECTFELSI
ncbi:hypothetical protein GCK32_014643, partial [Trichostrongylus colubriformis]